MLSAMLLMHNMKRSGPKIVPWDTPEAGIHGSILTDINVLVKLFYFFSSKWRMTVWVSSSKKCLNNTWKIIRKQVKINDFQVDKMCVQAVFL